MAKKNDNEHSDVEKLKAQLKTLKTKKNKLEKTEKSKSTKTKKKIAKDKVKKTKKTAKIEKKEILAKKKAEKKKAEKKKAEKKKVEDAKKKKEKEKKEILAKKKAEKKKAEAAKKKEEEKTLEEQLEEQLSDQEIENFKIEKVNMEKLTSKVCDILAEREVKGMIQSDIWKKLKLTSRDGSRLALKLERQGTITREKILEKGRWTYKLILKKTPISTVSIVNAPCLICPVEQKCTLEGEISPRTCVWIEEWVRTGASQLKLKT